MPADRFPLTPLQHAMVGAWLRRPHAGLDVEQWIVTLYETVDTRALRRAWREIVGNYGMLRASVDITDPTTPQQIIHIDTSEVWEELDWRDVPRDCLDAHRRAFLEHDRRRGLDLLQPPLWRVHLIRIGEAEYQFVCTYHHVLLGGRSLIQIGRELFARYDSLLLGESLPGEPEAPFRKFVECLQKIDTSASAPYWQKYLADRPPVRLPQPYRRTSNDGREVHTSIECERTLDAATTARLYSAARTIDVTLHTFTQAAWGLTLAAFTGEKDHTFGSVRACRKLPVDGIQRMVGMLINTVPFRVRVPQEGMVEPWLHALRNAQVDHRLHETSAAAEVARYVRQPADEPLFPTLLMFTDRLPESMLDVGGRPHPTRSVQLLERSEFPLALTVGAAETLTLRLEFDTARYDAATAERVLDHFATILAALPDYLDRPIAELPSVTPTDRERLLGWSRPASEQASCETVPAMIERQCLDRPDDVAIAAGERRVSYGELRQMAITARRSLERLGVARGDLVGVFCDRSPEMAALILGIWRIGAVYVPLDPKYPSQRLASIAADAAPTLIVHDRPLPAELSAIEFRAMPLDTMFQFASADQNVAHPSLDECAPAATLADRAVVLYTSGSTGTPKGVVLTHRNLTNHHGYVVRTLEMAPGDRLAPVSSINFDASIEEHFCPLIAGATVVLPTAEDLESCGRFFEFVERCRLTILDLPTSLWRELTNFLHESRREYPACVRLLFMGGEAATRTVYDRFLQVGGRRMRWINAYGPTETTIFSTAFEHRPDEDAATSDAPPIGRPIDNTRVFVLDAGGRLVPPGVGGELWIGGAGVAAGYLRREALTNERFVERPSSDLPDGRYYRTGDEVRFRDDGMLEYLGRLDDQVKLRGFRIEPGEIEALLLKHPAVRDAAVVVRTSPAGTQFLAGYAVLQPGASWDERSLREFVAARLPRYMVPKALVQLDALPQTPNGKIDRRALPDPCFSDSQDGCAAAARPAREPNDLERRLLDVWRTTLQMPDAGLDDDFFLLGGDSLRAMTLVAKLEQALGRTVSAARLFAAPTVAQLASDLASDAPSDAASVVPLRSGDASRPLFFIHSLAGDAWIYRELAQTLRTRDAVYGLQMPGLDGVPPECDDVEDWAAAYLEHVRNLQPTGPYRFAGYSSGGLMAFEMARQLVAQGETVEFLGLIDSGVPTIIERRLTASRWQRCAGLARSVPSYWAELREMTFAARWRRIGRFAVAAVKRCLSQRRATTDVELLDDKNILESFAEDISFFPPHRLELIGRHYRALDRYHPEAANVSAHLFRSARQAMFAVQTPTMGWDELIAGPLSVYQVGGAHSVLMRAPYVDRLAAVMDAAMTTAQATAVPGEPVAAAMSSS